MSATARPFPLAPAGENTLEGRNDGARGAVSGSLPKRSNHVRRLSGTVSGSRRNSAYRSSRKARLVASGNGSIGGILGSSPVRHVSVAFERERA
jgi:hypothetical protein